MDWIWIEIEPGWANHVCTCTDNVSASLHSYDIYFHIIFNRNLCCTFYCVCVRLFCLFIVYFFSDGKRWGRRWWWWEWRHSDDEGDDDKLKYEYEFNWKLICVWWKNNFWLNWCGLCGLWLHICIGSNPSIHLRICIFAALHLLLICLWICNIVIFAIIYICKIVIYNQFN